MKEEDIEPLFRQVQGEVPGSPIFVMKLAPKCRHLEVQLVADSYGEVCANVSKMIFIRYIAVPFAPLLPNVI